MATRSTRRGTLVAAAALGAGLIAAPAVFSMFSRAPSGGEMIDDFTPYMTEEVIGGFADDLALIDRAVGDAAPAVAALPTEVRTTYFGQLADAWPAIYDDMGGMLDTMGGNRSNFDAVAALPPFPLFPWFFVAPGAMAIGFALWGVRRSRRGPGVALVALGLGLVLAPAVFQMFTRAPRGADMIDDFRSLMTTERVQTMQGYFLVIGAGEGNLRNDIVPLLDSTGATPAVDEFSREWPRISNEMAPMIGAMGDNVDNFADVDALPPFDLFPWFFVVPGLALATLGAATIRRSPITVPANAPGSRTDPDSDPHTESAKGDT